MPDNQTTIRGGRRHGLNDQGKAQVWRMRTTTEQLAWLAAEAQRRQTTMSRIVRDMITRMMTMQETK